MEIVNFVESNVKKRQSAKRQKRYAISIQLKNK